MLTFATEIAFVIFTASGSNDEMAPFDTSRRKMHDRKYIRNRNMNNQIAAVGNAVRETKEVVFTFHYR